MTVSVKLCGEKQTEIHNKERTATYCKRIDIDIDDDRLKKRHYVGLG